MRLIIILISLSLLTTSSTWSSDSVIADSTELSNFQESTFIKMLNETNNGEIPYPFKNLIDKFQIGSKPSGSIVLVPDGRSLVKKFADFKNPRIIYEPFAAPNADSALNDKKRTEMLEKLNIEPGNLFVGMAPNHKALEVISFNPKTKEYDFFVVENYDKGQKPKIVSNPGLCLSCHQNKAPIFSRFPWTEMLGDTSKEFAEQAANGGEPIKHNHITDLIKKANTDRSSIEGIDLNDPSLHNPSTVANFDLAVRNGNSNLVQNQVCKTVCDDGDLACYNRFIRAGVNNDFGNFNVNQILEKINKIDIRSSAIPNRDPIKNVSYQVFGKKEFFTGNLAFLKDTDSIKYLDSEDITFIEAGTTGVGKHEFDNPMKDFSYADPTKKRGLNSDLIVLKNKIKTAKNDNEKMKNVFEGCMTQAIGYIFLPLSKKDQETVLSSKIVQKELMNPSRRLDAINLAIQSINKTEDKNKESSLVDCLEKITKSEIIPIYVFKDLGPVVEKINDVVKKPTDLLKLYCTQCHGPEGFIKLPLESLESMAKYKPTFSDKGPLERLEKKIMPPEYAPLKMTDEDRKAVIDALKSFK